MHTKTLLEYFAGDVSRRPIMQHEAPACERRSVHTLDAAHFAGAIRCDVKLHALWRTGPREFGSDTSVVATQTCPLVDVRLRGPLLLTILDSGDRVKVTLHRSSAVDTAPSVHTTYAGLPPETGSRLLDRHAELREVISRAVSPALDLQLQTELENILDSATLSTPLLVASIEKNSQTARLVQSCLRGDFGPLWGAHIYGDVVQSGPISSSLRQPRSVNVQIRYLDRKQWQEANLFFQSATTSITDAGEILVTSPLFDAEESCEDWMILASQERRRRSPSEVSVRATIECSVDQLRYFAPGEVWIQAQAFAAAQPATSPREIECQVCVSIPRHALEVWFTTPREASGSYGPVYSVMSRSVQQALRRWVPAFWTQPVNSFSARMAAMLARLYACSETSTQATRADLTPDWMSEKTTAYVWQTGAPVLRRRIAEERAGKLKNAYQCDVYARRQLEILADWIWKDRLIPGILQMEASLIESFIQLGSVCRQLDDARELGNAIAVRRSIGKALRAARRTMRKFFMKVDYSDLAPMLLIEATNALNRTVGREYPVTVTVTLRAPSGAEKKISNQTANFPPCGH